MFRRAFQPFSSSHRTTLYLSGKTHEIVLDGTPDGTTQSSVSPVARRLVHDIYLANLAPQSSLMSQFRGYHHMLFKSPGYWILRIQSRRQSASVSIPANPILCHRSARKPSITDLAPRLPSIARPYMIGLATITAFAPRHSAFMISAPVLIPESNMTVILSPTASTISGSASNDAIAPSTCRPTRPQSAHVKPKGWEKIITNLRDSKQPTPHTLSPALS